MNKKIKIDNDKIIKVLVTKNPKRPKSRAFNKFAIVMKYNGKKVATLRKEEGKHPVLDKVEKNWPRNELYWALRLGLAKLVASPKLA